MIDFTLFQGKPSDRHDLGLSMVKALKTSGFFYLKFHGIRPSLVTSVFQSSARFFARPQRQKDALSWTSPKSNRGYVSVSCEELANVDEVISNTLRPSIPYMKETLEIGREGVEDQPNQWPDHFDQDGKDFKETMQTFIEALNTLHKQIMQAIAFGMTLPEDFFDKYVDAGDSNLRLIHYPPVKKEVFQNNPNQARDAEHSDYGSITLLFQDHHGGLQVRGPNGTFVDAEPIGDSIVVNAGDLLARWSNDTIKSARHRVVEPFLPLGKTREDMPETYPSRYSIAYFCQPNNDKVIDALNGTFTTVNEQTDKKYPPIMAGEYLAQRFSATD